MPTPTPVVDGQAAIAAHIEQFVDTWTGTPGKGMPFLNTAVDDAANFAADLRNLGAGSKGLRVRKADGTELLVVDASGLRASPDGIVTAAAVATLAGTEALSNKSITMGGRLLEKRGSSVASATSITLPTDGNIIPVTGTTQINTIAATGLAGLRVILEFQSAGCLVKNGVGNIRLPLGDFSSLQFACLELESDGVSWNEVGRSAPRAAGIAAYATGGPTLTTSWQTVGLDKSTAAPVTGRYRIAVCFFVDVNGAGDNGAEMRGTWRVNTGAESTNFVSLKGNAGDRLGGAQVGFASLTAGDTVDLRVQKGSGSGTSAAVQSHTSLSLSLD